MRLAWAAMTQPVGRPVIGPKIEVRLSPEYLAGIDQYRGSLNRSEFVRRAVKYYLINGFRYGKEARND